MSTHDVRAYILPTCGSAIQSREDARKAHVTYLLLNPRGAKLVHLFLFLCPVHCGVPLHEWSTPKLRGNLECWIGVQSTWGSVECWERMECRIALQFVALLLDIFLQWTTPFITISITSQPSKYEFITIFINTMLIWVSYLSSYFCFCHEVFSKRKFWIGLWSGVWIALQKYCWSDWWIALQKL